MYTIVIPTYGRAERLKKAILSALNQTLKAKEIIIIDDNSNEEWSCNTQKVIELLDNEKIIYIKNEKNMGANYCRNIGLEKATGKYIAFLDDDDEFYREKLEVISANLSNNPDLIYSSVELYNENLKKSNFMFRKEKKIKEKILMYNFIGGTSSVIIKRDFYKSVGGFDNDLPSCQDWDFWAKSIFNRAKIKAIEKTLVRIIVHNSNNRISNNLSKRIDGHKRLFDKFRAYYTEDMDLKKIKKGQAITIANLYYDMNNFEDYLKIMREINISRYRLKDILRRILLILKLKIDRFQIQKIEN